MRGNNEHLEAKETLDKLKWLVVFILFIAVVWGNFYFSEPESIYTANFIIRIVSVVVSSAIILLLAATTQRGKQILTFAREARIELRKVVWPNRREAIQTTILVAVITIIASLLLWGLDSITIRLVSFLTLLGH